MKKTVKISACAMILAAGTTAGAQTIDWMGAVDGDWGVAGNWLGMDVPNSPTETGHLGLVGPYTVTMTTGYSINEIMISNPDVLLSVGTSPVDLAGGLVNDGTILLNTNATSFNSILRFNSDTAISGSGEIILNGAGSPDDAQVVSFAPFILTHDASHTIRGAGQITGTMINLGTIIADSMVGQLRLNGRLT